ncbi:hypothetical protein BP5796_11778 [Coleophoma crateriformis]|uniref:Uncharacterized protein n=1 Tax=Coleophoma crateriformis TaxID=565419 RepID=A0A3D8QEA4_9HELO|nr:hypothetical protein BP5796_11778 [Coleophoma crateriformis]
MAHPGSSTSGISEQGDPFAKLKDTSSAPRRTFNLTQVVNHGGALAHGLTAKIDIDRGDQIIEVCDAYILLPKNSHISSVCYWCFSREPNGPYEKLMPCKACMKVVYCSYKCQRTAWEHIHKAECPPLRNLGIRPLPTVTHALLQALLHFTRREISDPRKNPAATLVGSVDDMKASNGEGAMQLQAMAAVHYSGVPPQLIPLACELFCKMEINSFQVKHFNEMVGYCFDPLLARMNHSCDPNAEVSFSEHDYRVTALRGIKKDEPVVISYIDVNNDRDTRRKELKERWHFDCKCVRCEGEAGPEGKYFTLTDYLYNKRLVQLQPKIDEFVNHPRNKAGLPNVSGRPLYEALRHIALTQARAEMDGVNTNAESLALKNAMYDLRWIETVMCRC